MGGNSHILDQKNKNGTNTTNDKSGQAKSKLEKGTSKNSNVIEISTDFINDTDREQTYKFRLEKTRKAVLTVNFQKGFTVGGKARFSVELPKLTGSPQVSAETDMTINVTKQEGENVEETVVLETTSDIKVKERSKYVAKVVLAETKVCYDFTVWCRLSMPLGGAPVSIMRKKDGVVFFSSTLKRLDKIFERYKSQVKIKTSSSDSQTENYVIDIKTMGIIEGVRLSDQRIILESSDIPMCSKNEYVSNSDDKIATETMMINVDYVPQPTAAYPYTGSSAQRPRSIDGPIIEELTEQDDEETNGSLGTGTSARISPRTPTNRGPSSLGMIPTIVATSPSSAGSSPLSEKPGSEMSNKTSTTV